MCMNQDATALAIQRINDARVAYYAACTKAMGAAFGNTHPTTLECARLTVNAKLWREQS